MFVQIHMLQSMPPSNLNRDETGQPKRCVFGGVTRGRISSQCLKRNIRHSVQFRKEFGSDLASRTLYLPRMVADALRGQRQVPEDELGKVMSALAAQFKKERTGAADERDDERPTGAGDSDAMERGSETTGQLVFFPPPFAAKIAELVADLRQHNERAYKYFLDMKPSSRPSKEQERELKTELEKFRQQVAAASRKLTVDIGLFGRMTTSDLVVDVEAACQVAHAISTHEAMVESDYFTAMDDKKLDFAANQMDQKGAAFLGSGDTETYFVSAVYYKYLNLDVDALRRQLPSLGTGDAARVAGVLVEAAALANPTGKQNSFAAHGVPELVLVELSQTRRPVTYANAFLEPVEGGPGRNLMTESARALNGYVRSVATAFAPADTRRLLMAVGAADAAFADTHELGASYTRVRSLDELVKSVVGHVSGQADGAAA